MESRKSFGGKNLCSLLSDLAHQKPAFILTCYWTLFKSAERFSASATLHSQKIVKERAYIPTSFQAPSKNAIFFLIFIDFIYYFQIKQDSFIDNDGFLFLLLNKALINIQIRTFLVSQIFS